MCTGHNGHLGMLAVGCRFFTLRYSLSNPSEGYSALYQLTVNCKQNPLNGVVQVTQRRSFKAFSTFECYKTHNYKMFCTDNMK